MLDAIVNGIKDYKNNIPAEIPKAMFLSGLYSFTVTVLFSKNFDTRTGQIAAVLAATASLIDGLIMPLFRKFVAKPNGDITWFENLGARLISLGITQALFQAASTKIPQFQAYRVNVMAAATFMLVIDFFFGKDKRPTEGASPYLLSL